MAQKVSPHNVKLIGSPWSPPAWLKTNNKLNDGGTLKGNPGGHHYKIWAHYLVKLVKSLC